MRTRHALGVVAPVLAAALSIAALTPGSRAFGTDVAEPHVAAASDVAAGRYLLTVGGCHDCHTPGWRQSQGHAPISQWLTGTPVGRRGRWGTTYAQNLRLLPAKMSEDDFVAMLHSRTDRPPMPWMNVNRLNPTDSRAIYRFLKSLGPGGAEMPPGLPPGQEPTTPYVVMEPPTQPHAHAG